MPFATSARISVENEGPERVRNLYFAIDYVTLAALPDGLGRFHAQYRQATPCRGVTSDGKNLSGQDNYVFLDATGRDISLASRRPSCKTRTAGSARGTI